MTQTLRHEQVLLLRDRTAGAALAPLNHGFVMMVCKSTACHLRLSSTGGVTETCCAMSSPRRARTSQLVYARGSFWSFVSRYEVQLHCCQQRGLL